MIFYTTDRNNSLKKDAILDLTAYKDIQPEELQKHVNMLFPGGVSSHGEQYFLQGQTLANSVNSVLEIIFEYVRRSNFQERPSRCQTFFAFDDIKQAEEFNRKTNSDGSIWQVECDSYFRADMNLLNLNNSLLVVSNNAYKYWKGLPDTDVFWEYLLRPPVRVIKKVKN